MNQSKGKWWLAAVLTPFIGFGIGLFLGVSAPRNSSDWFGFHVLVPMFLGLLAGNVCSCIAMVISVVRKEKHSWAGMLVALPSLLLIISFCSHIPQARENAKKGQEHFLAYQKQVQEQETRVRAFTELFRTNSTLIATDEFWNAQTNRDAFDGLCRLFEDKSFHETPQIREYLIGHWTNGAGCMIDAGRLNDIEQVEIVTNIQNEYKFRQFTMRHLIGDDNFSMTDYWKAYVYHQFPEEIGRLIACDRLKRSDLDTIIADPDIPDAEKKLPQQALSWGKYRAVSNQTNQSTQ